MKRNFSILLVLAFSILSNSHQCLAEQNSEDVAVVTSLSQDELNQLKKNSFQSKTLLQKLHQSLDKGVSAGRSVLKSFNQQDRQLMIEYQLLREQLTKHKQQIKAKSQSSQSQKNTQQEIAMKNALNQTKAQLKEIYIGKMQLIGLLAATEDISVANELIEASRSAHRESHVHHSVFVGLAELGALDIAADYAQEVLDDDTSGVVELTAALMYFSYYPSNDAKLKVEQYVDIDFHPYIRDMAAWVYAKLVGISAKEKVVAAIEKSYIDRMGVQSKYFGLLGLAEIVEPTEFVDILVGKDYPNTLYQSALQYSQFKHGDDALKETLTRGSLVSGMREEEQFQAMQFVLNNNRTDLLIELNVLIETDQGLTAIAPLAIQTKQLGYQLTGTLENPVIMPLENESSSF